MSTPTPHPHDSKPPESRARRTRAVECPNCNAQPGTSCTQPNDRNGRSAVSWYHFARERAAGL